MTAPATAALIREKLLAALNGSRRPLTTAQLRTRVETQLEQPIVIEKVYRNLIALERRGLVQRSDTTGRDAQWKHA